MRKKFDSEKQKVKIISRLTEMMFKHREELGLTQREVAEQLDRDEKTYQRQESSGNGLSKYLYIRDIFSVLHFSSMDVIYVLDLPPLTSSEMEELYKDEETLKSIREKGIHSTIRQTCGEMENTTIEKLLCTLLDEYLKRKGYRV